MLGEALSGRTTDISIVERVVPRSHAVLVEDDLVDGLWRIAGLVKSHRGDCSSDSRHVAWGLIIAIAVHPGPIAAYDDTFFGPVGGHLADGMCRLVRSTVNAETRVF